MTLQLELEVFTMSGVKTSFQDSNGTPVILNNYKHDMPNKTFGFFESYIPDSTTMEPGLRSSCSVTKLMSVEYKICVL